MRERAISTREVLNRHRWAIGLMESRATPGPASLRLHDAVLGCLREGGFSIEMTIQAYSVQDAYIYGFALQEKNLPFDTAEQSAAVAEAQVRHFAELAEQRQFATLTEEFPYLAEVVAGHVAKVGYDFTAAFIHGLDLILDALENRRETPERRAHPPARMTDDVHAARRACLARGGCRRAPPRTARRTDRIDAEALSDVLVRCTHAGVRRSTRPLRMHDRQFPFRRLAAPARLFVKRSSSGLDYSFPSAT
jgi:hypothetical protein